MRRRARSRTSRCRGHSARKTSTRRWRWRSGSTSPGSPAGSSAPCLSPTAKTTASCRSIRPNGSTKRPARSGSTSRSSPPPRARLSTARWTTGSWASPTLPTGSRQSSKADPRGSPLLPEGEPGFRGACLRAGERPTRCSAAGRTEWRKAPRWWESRIEDQIELHRVRIVALNVLEPQLELLGDEEPYADAGHETVVVTEVHAGPAEQFNVRREEEPAHGSRPQSVEFHVAPSLLHIAG